MSLSNNYVVFGVEIAEREWLSEVLLSKLA
jgi:hypothetical protein